MKRIIIVSIIILISAVFIFKAWTHEIDDYGTKEINLVEAAGKNVCMSCIGLADENILEKLFGEDKEADNNE